MSLTREQEREYIVRCIEAITSALKGPMPNLERMLLVADRKDLRMRLLDLDSPLPSPPSDQGSAE